MNKTSVIAIIGVVALGIVLFLLFSTGDRGASLIVPNNATTTQNAQQDQENTQGEETNTANTNNQTNGQSNTNGQIVNAVVLGEVEAGNLITVPRAQLEEDGYVVLYRVNSNGESDVVGHSDLLEAGNHTNISIQLEGGPAVERQAIVAALHEDDGDGKFEYPEADGYLISSSGTVISDIDVVGVVRSDREGMILENQVEAYLDENFDAE